MAHIHQAVLVEFPVLVPVGAIPLAGIVVPFIGEAHGDTVPREGPDLLDEAIFEFLVPLARQELDDLRPPPREFRAIPPAAVLGIGERDTDGIARIPGILRHPRLLGGGLGRERRKRRTGVHAQASLKP